MNLFRHCNHYISLPDKEAFISLPFVLFGHIEKRSLTMLGWRWRKRTVILNPNGDLIIYKHFLGNIPDQIIHLKEAESIHVRMDKNICHIKIYDHTPKRTELRIKGTKARLWATKIFMYESPRNDCKQHSTREKVECPAEHSLEVIHSKFSISSICDTDLTSKSDQFERFSKVSVTSLSAESFPDYTTSDVSYEGSQQEVNKSVNTDHLNSKNGINFLNRIQDMEGIKLCEVTATCKENSKLCNVESIPIHNNMNANKSVSLEHLNSIAELRQDRFRKHLQSIVESRFYNNLTECSLNCTISSIQKFRQQACHLRMSQIYVPCNSLLMNDEIGVQELFTQRCKSLSPLPIDINCKAK